MGKRKRGQTRWQAAFAPYLHSSRAAFMPYWPLGFPTPEESLAYVETLAAAGADMLELGIPFSDPLADGPTIQTATQQALTAGTTVARCLKLVASLREKGITIPCALMTYLNPVLAYGIEQFVTDAVSASVDGFIIPDMPPGDTPQSTRGNQEQREDVLLGGVADRATRPLVVFRNPIHVVWTDGIAHVVPLLGWVEYQVASRGLYAVGWVAYEAAPAMDSALHVRSLGNVPLLWFGLFSTPELLDPTRLHMSGRPPPLTWTPQLSLEEYIPRIQRIKAYIAAGYTYQVNYTFPLRTPWRASTWNLFTHLVGAQDPPYGAYIDARRFVVCSASPELFFALHGDQRVSRPMKGRKPFGGKWGRICGSRDGTDAGGGSECPDRCYRPRHGAVWLLFRALFHRLYRHFLPRQIPKRLPQPARHPDGSGARRDPAGRGEGIVSPGIG